MSRSDVLLGLPPPALSRRANTKTAEGGGAGGRPADAGELRVASAVQAFSKCACDFISLRGFMWVLRFVDQKQEQKKENTHEKDARRWEFFPSFVFWKVVRLL